MPTNTKDDLASPFPLGACCYFARQADLSPETIRGGLKALGLDGVWLSLVPVTLRDEPWWAIAIQTCKDRGLAGGWPMAIEEIAAALSSTCEALVELLVAPDGDGAVLGLFCGGQRRRDPLGDPLPEKWGPSLAGLTPKELMRLPAVEEVSALRCGEHAELFHTQRRLKVPAWADKGVDIFRFSEHRGDNSGSSEGGEGRLCLIALDLEDLQRDLSQRNVGQTLQVLEFYSNRDRKRFLGPLMADLPVCVEELRGLNMDTPARQVPNLPDLAELLALVNTWLSVPGHYLAYLDEVFFPLLNLANGSMPDLDPEDLAEMSDRGLTAAMADQLPYHAPEGELMESFDDGELTPLMDTLIADTSRSSAIWLLDHSRLLENLDALDPEQFGGCCEQFIERWWEGARPDWDGEKRAWLEERVEKDEPAIQTFFHTWNELRTLLHMAELNHLRVALLFYE